jgi:hypothetical protein
VSETSVDQLRQQLRDLGYLSHGLERWFAGDPWRSRSFWAGLLTTAAKAATVVALFAAAPMIAVMLFRNSPVEPAATVVLIALYVAAAFLTVGMLTVVIALLLRWRSYSGIDNPWSFNLLAAAMTALLGLAIGVWWWGFERMATITELIVLATLLVLLTIVAIATFSAALLAFSIHETQRIPLVRRAPRKRTVATIGTLLVAVIGGSSFAHPTDEATAPRQIPVSPRPARVALVAVDGLSNELLAARPELSSLFRYVAPLRGGSSAPPPERWATLGTGTAAELHGVRSVEGIRLAGSRSVLQSVSRTDLLLRELAPSLLLAEKQPLPPTARRREYIWESLAARGITALSVNWWTSPTRTDAALASIGQERILANAPRLSDKDLAAWLDAAAIRETVELTRSRKPALVTVYLPALDILLNRLELDSSSRVSASLAATTALGPMIGALRSEGYEVLLVGVTESESDGVLASTMTLEAAPAVSDIAPTLYDLFGFPASAEMAGRSLLPGSKQSRIASYGARDRRVAEAPPSREYYESLRSLGYIR